jgi:hypothetical protein
MQPASQPTSDERPALPAERPRCGRWWLKPFELLRPVLLRPDRPLTLGDFLEAPDPKVLAEFQALDLEQRQALVSARIAGAPPDRPMSLFGRGGYTYGSARQEVEDGTPLGVRLIEAESKLVGLLLEEALAFGPISRHEAMALAQADDAGP